MQTDVSNHWYQSPDISPRMAVSFRAYTHGAHGPPSLPPAWCIGKKGATYAAGFRDLINNWLQVLGTTETPQIDQGVGHQFHPVVALLDGLETEEQPLAFVLPRKRPLDALP